MKPDPTRSETWAQRHRCSPSLAREAPSSSRAAFFALALAVFWPAIAAALISPPVNLGAASLTTALRLWKWNGSAWSAASTAGLTMNDLGNGDYTVSGLPVALTTERYQLFIADAADDDRALAAYEYGAIPGERIVYQLVAQIPSQPRIFKRGDTHGSITLVITQGLPTAISDPTTTAVFGMRPLNSATATLTARPSTISNITDHAATGTKGATFDYVIEATTLSTSGRYLGEFTITFPDAKKQTVPTDDSLTFVVKEDVD